MNVQKQIVTLADKIANAMSDEAEAARVKELMAILRAEVIDILLEKPEKISTSQSFCRGYVKCVRDKVALIKQLFGDNHG